MPLSFPKRLPNGDPVSHASTAARSMSSLACRLRALKLCYRHLSRANAAPPCCRLRAHKRCSRRSMCSFDCGGCLPNSFVIMCRAPGPCRHAAVLFRRLSKAIAAPPCYRQRPHKRCHRRSMSSIDCHCCLSSSFVIICRVPRPGRNATVLFRRLSRAIAAPL